MINMAISSKLLSVKLEHDVNPPYVSEAEKTICKENK